MPSTINNTINLFFGNSVYKSKLSDHNQTQNHGLNKTPNRATLNCDYTPLSIENKIPRPDGTRKYFQNCENLKIPTVGLQSDLTESDMSAAIEDAMTDADNATAPKSGLWVMNESNCNFVFVNFKPALSRKVQPEIEPALSRKVQPEIKPALSHEVKSEINKKNYLNKDGQYSNTKDQNTQSPKPVEQNIEPPTPDHSADNSEARDYSLDAKYVSMLNLDSLNRLHKIDTITVKKGSVFYGSFGCKAIEGPIKVQNTFYEPGTGAIIAEIFIEGKPHKFSLFFINSEQKFDFPQREFSIIGKAWRERKAEFDQKLDELSSFASDLPTRTKRSEKENRKIERLMNFLDAKPKKTEIKPVEPVKSFCLDSRIEEVNDEQGRPLKAIILNRMQHHESNLPSLTTPKKYPASERQIKYRKGSDLHLRFSQNPVTKVSNSISMAQRKGFQAKVKTNAPIHSNANGLYNDQETQAYKLIDPVTFKGTYLNFIEDRKKHSN